MDHLSIEGVVKQKGKRSWANLSPCPQKDRKGIIPSDTRVKQMEEEMTKGEIEKEYNNNVRISIDTEKENAEVPLLTEMVTYLEQEMSQLSRLTPDHCIYTVPQQLRVKNPAAYTPKIVSIGPIHHKRKGLEAMEEYKLRYLQRFLDRVNIGMKQYADFVKDREERLRRCYVDTIDLKSHDFVKIMMVDSAFVYEMLVRVCSEVDDSCRIFNRPFLVMNVIEDLMLLENQIPLFILEDLFNLDEKARSAPQQISTTASSIVPPPEAGVVSFMDLVYTFVNSRLDIGTSWFNLEKVCHTKEVHLLDCLQRCYLCRSPDSPPSKGKQGHCDSLSCYSGKSNSLASEPEKVRHVVPLCLWRSLIPPCSIRVPPRRANCAFDLLVPVPTITTLHQSGVKFDLNTKSDHLLDIKFDRLRGVLKIPHFFMGDSTETIFRNLLAFEQCHYKGETLFADYFMLLDQLISEPSDIDLLVQSGVVKNTLGDSTRAANLMNNIAQGLRISRQPHFDVIRRELTEYYKVPWHKWKASLRHDYFNNPWAGISVIAAVILLVLTIIQTVYAIISK